MLEAAIFLSLLEPAPPPHTIGTPIGRVAWPDTADTMPIERGYWPELERPPKGFIWAQDAWASRALEYDKLEHLAGGYAEFLSLCALADFMPPRAAASVAALSLLWEVKDGFYNPENFPGHDNYFLGDGFSWKDWAATLAGIAIGWGLWEARHD